MQIFLLLILVGLLNGYSLIPCMAEPEQANVAPVTVEFQSKGKPIRMEWFRSRTKDHRPVVILLHGQGGIESKDGYFRYFASRLCSGGINAGVLHYFDRDRIEMASSRDMSSHFSDWVGTISDAIAHAQKETGSKNVALIGHSLGAQLALVKAANDSRVACLVEMSGSLVYPGMNVAKMPPVLIIHGDKDRVVPIAKERQLEASLIKAGRQYEKRILPGQGHSLDLKPALDVIDFSSDFIQRMF